MVTRNLFLVLTTLVVFTGTTFANTAKIKPQAPLDADLLDSEFIRLSKAIYSKNIAVNSAVFKNINSFQSRLNSLISENNETAAIRLVIRNLELIKNNIDHNSVFTVIRLLLKNNEYLTANNLLEHIKKEGDVSLISNIVFLFSKYHFNHEDYKKTLQTLDGIIPYLSVNDGHFALIMNGISLQKIKLHRKALVSYEKVPETSVYYEYAQLNKAIVYIRQGWWSDAHLIITHLLNKRKTSKSKHDRELVNRLYLVLGYSFLQQEYFRESRNAFRNIEKDSIYANRALLGIALAAANQGDNVGALNVLNILQQKNEKILPVDESYLLLPYIYERIGQNKTASASYSLALSYYENRIKELNSLIRKYRNKSFTKLPIVNNKLSLDGNLIELNDRNNEIFNNYRQLKMFSNIVSDPETSRKISLLTHKYQALLDKIVSEKLKQNIEYLESYQNQSQFGIARLYDNSRKKAR